MQVTDEPNTGEQSGVDLTETLLAPVVAAAVDFWAEQGDNAEGLESLLNTDIRVEDLGGNLLGETSGSAIKLDDDAAGYGWSDSVAAVMPVKSISCPCSPMSSVMC